jgi:uncharacterized protein (TIGR01777 family)
MATVLIGGGSGMIGTRLSELLTNKGYKVLHLSRNRDINAPIPKYHWDLETGEIDMEAINQADFIINLAGAGIADKRWTKDRKSLIINSRVESTLLLKKALEQRDQAPKAIICASAIGFYGDRNNEQLTEESAPGRDGFLSESVQAWENASQQLKGLDSRLVIIRIGVVLSTKGGALEPFVLQNKFRIGTYFGDGQQWYSWIHIDDLCRIFIEAIENEDMKGTYNGVSPEPKKLYNFVKDIAEARHTKAFMIPAPTFAMRLAMGEMADVVLSSAKVSSAKIEKTGFQFKHPKLVEAVRHLIDEQV